MTDLHVVPNDDLHKPEPWCWCQPIVDYENPLDGHRVWLHRKALDLPHREAARVAMGVTG